MNKRSIDCAGSYGFDLSEAEEARATALHRENIVFDWLQQDIGGPRIFEYFPHALRSELDALLRELPDGLESFFKVKFWCYQMAIEQRSNLIEEWYRKSGLTCGTRLVPVYDGTSRAAWAEEEANMSRAARELPWLRHVTTAAEIRRAKMEGVIARYGHWQPIYPIPRDLNEIDDAYRRGLRSLMLTYNRMDNVGVGCTERVDAGLSRFGLEVMGRCESLGIIVDVSHCGLMTTLDACRSARRPVNANHTCARAVCDVARAKSDDELRAIADTGGIVGVVTVPHFISREKRPTVDAVLDHFDHIAGLIGWRHVCIGTDWPYQAPPGIFGKLLNATLIEAGFRPEDRAGANDSVVGFEDYRDLPNLTRGMVKRGYTDEQIRGVLGDNALRVFQEICG
jgi:membrane dipeptidase